MQSGKPLLQIPLRFADDERVEMLITPDLVTEDDPRGQASHPSDGLLPRRREFPGEIPPEMDENLEEVAYRLLIVLHVGILHGSCWSN